MKRIERNNEDYLELLIEQVEFMIDACELYDNGKFSSAKLMATNIRTVVHQTQKSVSLLTHLKKQNNMKFYNTSFKPKNVVYFLGLVFMCVTGKNDKIPNPIFLPILKPKEFRSSRWINFNKWWNNKIIVSENLTFSRSEMIRFMANQDGGAHVDEEVEEKYYKISKATESMIYYSTKSLIEDPYVKGEPYKYLHFAVVRQIAHELIITLNKEFNLNINYHPTNMHHLKDAVSIGDSDDFCMILGSGIEYE